MARGRLPSMIRLVIDWRVAGFRTSTRLGCAQETYARCGAPAKTISEGSFDVVMVLTTRIEARSMMLMESEMKLATHSSDAVRNLAVTGSRPTGMLPIGRGLPEAMSKIST